MQALIQKFLFSKNCIFTLWHFLYQTSPKFSLLLPSHNCIIITMFSFQGANLSFLKETQWSFTIVELQSISFRKLVEISGIEPLTSCLQGRRSPSWAKPPYRRNQIHNLRIDLIQAQCSTVSLFVLCPFKPASLGFEWKPEFKETQWSINLLMFQSISWWWRVPGSNRWPPACKAGALPAELTPHTKRFEVVGQNGLEPSTSRLSVVCSSQLSYWPISTSHFLGTTFVCTL